MTNIIQQTGTSRVTNLASRAARLGCGISFVALSAMLGARPALADPAPQAQVLSNNTPASSSLAAFVTAGSQQSNNQAAISALLNAATAASTVYGNNDVELPSTSTVGGNTAAAYATGSAQTNTVDLANIGISNGEVASNGIAVLADQANTFTNVGEDPSYDSTTTVNAAVTNTNLENEVFDAVANDSLAVSNNLVAAQATGNIANSSVNGVVPVGYTDAGVPGATLLQNGSGSASGNVVVSTSQTNSELEGTLGSVAALGSPSNGEAGNYVGNYITTADNSEDDLSQTVTTDVSGNALSAEFLGNSATNNIGLVQTSGTTTGAPAFGGALVVANQQTNIGGGSFLSPAGQEGAINNNSQVYNDMYGEEDTTLTLSDGTATTNNNIISAAAYGNYAVGASGVAGNEISLGINLVGNTTSGLVSNEINTSEPGGTVTTGGDLLVSNLQNNNNLQLGSSVFEGNIYSYFQGLSGSSVGLAGNVVTANAVASDASNAIATPSGPGVNLITGVAALSSLQDSYGGTGASATVSYSGIYSGADYDGYTSLTNSSVNMSNNTVSANAGVNLVTNAISLAANAVNAGPLGDSLAPAYANSTTTNPETADGGISLNNVQLQDNGSSASAALANVEVGEVNASTSLTSGSFNVSNPAMLATASGNDGTNSINVNGSASVSGSVALANTQEQNGNGVSASINPSEESVYGAVAYDELQSYDGESSGISGSNAALTGTDIATKATDNNAANTLYVSGGQLSGAAGGVNSLGLNVTADDGLAAAQANADLALSNAQQDGVDEASASTNNTAALLVADASGAGVSNAAFTVGGPSGNSPTIQALAIGNEVVNALTAAADTLLTDTAGLASMQNNETGADATVSLAQVGIVVNGPQQNGFFDSGDDGGDISNTSVTVGTGAIGGSNANIVRALAYENQASNVLSVSAGTVAPNATTPDFAVLGSYISEETPLMTDLTNEDTRTGVGAAYGLLNDQLAEYNNANASITGAQVGATLGNDTTNPSVADVTVNTSGNAQVASIFGNQASNAGSFAANNLSADEYFPVMDVTNLQSTNLDLESHIDDTDANAFVTQILGTGGVTGSSLGVSGNTALTQAEGNQAANSLLASGGSIIYAGNNGDFGVGASFIGDGYATNDLAFGVTNLQTGDSYLGVGQLQTNVLLSTGGDVSSSSLAADSNALEAAGYQDNATNTLAFSGTTLASTLDTSAGVVNVQNAEGPILISLGSPPVAAIPGDPAVSIASVPYTVASNDGVNSAVLSDGGSQLTVTGQALVFNVTGLSGTALTDFEALFSGGAITTNSGSLTLASGYTYTIANTAALGDINLYSNLGSAVEQQSTAFEIPATDGTPAIPAAPSVLINVAGNIDGSTLDVSGNAFDGTAIANNAVNTETIAANTVNGGVGYTDAPFTGGVFGGGAGGLASYVVSNLQSYEEIVSTSVYGEAGINPNNTSSITDSTLNVSNNTQVAKAEGNVAASTLTLAATNAAGDGETTFAPTAAVVSSQVGLAPVSASVGSIGDTNTTGFLVTAPGAITGSTLTMDNNSTQVLAVMNDAANLLSVSATNLGTSNPELGNAEAQVAEGVEVEVYADYSLVNAQDAAEGGVTATAVTEVTNADSNSITTSGLQNSTADLSGNTTTVDGYANTASNTLNMTATNSAATGAIANDQTSETSVTAMGNADVSFALNGGGEEGPAAATDSSVTVDHNALRVQAIADQATNVLNATTAANYGPQSGASGNSSGVSATYAVLNDQANSGPVSSSFTNG
jgi:hypothetical protein